MTIRDLSLRFIWS